MKPIKLSQKKKQDFETLFGVFVEGGHDVFLADGQTELHIYPKTEKLSSIIFKINGSWELD